MDTSRKAGKEWDFYLQTDIASFQGSKWMNPDVGRAVSREGRPHRQLGAHVVAPTAESRFIAVGARSTDAHKPYLQIDVCPLTYLHSGSGVVLAEPRLPLFLSLL